MKLYDDLVWRGLIKDFSSPDLIDKLNNEKLTFYIGTDPTADSLHLGHLSSFLISKRLIRNLINPINLKKTKTITYDNPACKNCIYKNSMLKF